MKPRNKCFDRHGGFAIATHPVAIRAVFVLGAFAGRLGLPDTSFGQFSFQTVALSGQQAPGAPAGVNYLDLRAPALNNNGELAYSALLAGSGVEASNNAAMYGGAAGNPQLIARTGDAAPGTPPGVIYSSLNAGVVNDYGQVGYSAALTIPGSAYIENAIYATVGGSPLLVAREGEPAPGTTRSYFRLGSPYLNDTGQVLYFSQLTALPDDPPSPTRSVGIYAGPTAAPQLLARTGEPAPGAGAGVNYSSFSTHRFNDAGRVIYRGELSGSGAIAASSVIYVNGGGEPPQIVARSGQPAPGAGAGVRYEENFGDVVINDAGKVAYQAILTGGGLGIFSGDPPAPQLIARRGGAAPGTAAGVVYDYLNVVQLNEAGRAAFAASLSGPGVTIDNDFAIYAGAPGAMKLIARKGDAAPGVPSGINYYPFGPSCFNDRGQIMYLANLFGSGVGASNHFAIYAFDPAAGHRLIAREGDLFDVGGGDFRTIAMNSLLTAFAGSSGSDDTLTGLSDDGRLAIRLGFTDGSSGVFVTTIPEPAAASSLAAAASALLRRRRSRIHGISDYSPNGDQS